MSLRVSLLDVRRWSIVGPKPWRVVTRTSDTAWSITAVFAHPMQHAWHERELGR
jgi:hypothetical protein